LFKDVKLTQDIFAVFVDNKDGAQQRYTVEDSSRVVAFSTGVPPPVSSPILMLHLSQYDTQSEGPPKECNTGASPTQSKVGEQLKEKEVEEDIVVLDEEAPRGNGMAYCAVGNVVGLAGKGEGKCAETSAVAKGGRGRGRGRGRGGGGTEGKRVKVVTGQRKAEELSRHFDTPPPDSEMLTADAVLTAKGPRFFPTATATATTSNLSSACNCTKNPILAAAFNIWERVEGGRTAPQDLYSRGSSLSSYYSSEIKTLEAAREMLLVAKNRLAWEAAGGNDLLPSSSGLPPKSSSSSSDSGGHTPYLFQGLSTHGERPLPRLLTESQRSTFSPPPLAVVKKGEHHYSQVPPPGDRPITPGVEEEKEEEGVEEEEARRSSAATSRCETTKRESSRVMKPPGEGDDDDTAGAATPKALSYKDPRLAVFLQSLAPGEVETLEGSIEDLWSNVLFMLNLRRDGLVKGQQSLRERLAEVSGRAGMGGETRKLVFFLALLTSLLTPPPPPPPPPVLLPPPSGPPPTPPYPFSHSPLPTPAPAAMEFAAVSRGVGGVPPPPPPSPLATTFKQQPSDLLTNMPSPELAARAANFGLKTSGRSRLSLLSDVREAQQEESKLVDLVLLTEKNITENVNNYDSRRCGGVVSSAVEQEPPLQPHNAPISASSSLPVGSQLNLLLRNIPALHCAALFYQPLPLGILKPLAQSAGIDTGKLQEDLKTLGVATCNTTL